MFEAVKKITGTMVAFGDVVQLSKERSQDPKADGFERYIGLEHLEPSDLKVRSWGSISDGVTFTSAFRPGQVLFGKRRAYQRKVAVAEFSGVCSGDIYILEPKGDKLLPELLPFICQSEPFYDYVISMSQGGLSPRVNWKALAKYEFVLPAREEQRRVLEALQAAERASEAHLALIDAIRIVQAATLQEKLKADNATPVPLGDLLTQSPRNGCSAPASSAPTGHWVLALSAISRWGYRADQLKPVEKTPEMEAAIIEPGDLVVSRSNTRELVGLPAVFAENRNDVSYPDTMMRLTLDGSSVDARFVEMCLRTPECRRQIQSYAAGTSASMKKINGTNLRKVIVPTIPIDRQREVLRQVGQMTVLLSETENRISEAMRMKSRVLEQSIVEA